MQRSENIIKHFVISACSLAIMFLLITVFSPIIDVVLQNPQVYLDINLGKEEMNFFLIKTLAIVVSVLISYIIYLLLSSKTRVELAAAMMTNDLYTKLEHLRKLYEDSPVPYMTLDKKGNILEPNKATLRFFDVVANEIEGKNLFRYQPEDDAERAEKLFHYFESNVPVNREEVRMITKSGLVKWALLSIFKLEGGAKNGGVGLATLVDISQEKELDNAKTQFLSLASHQLRTPIASIKWFLDMLLSGDLGETTPKQQEYLERMSSVNTNMIELVDTLLNVSRIEIGSMDAELKETNVPQIIENLLTELSIQIEQKKLNIVRDYGNDLSLVKSDPKFLRIVIQNLLSNSIKYTPEGGTVTIRLKDLFGEKSITVEDTGVGIPAADQGKIFKKLFRADNVKRLEGSQGTGLGLYLVKSLVEILGGNIEFTSEENKGSTFTVKL